MFVFRFRHIIYIIGLLSVSNLLYSQGTVYRNTLSYTQKSGLSSPNIHKITQDKFGFLWIATQDGLNRFDGIRFIQYNQDQAAPRNLFSADIRDIIPDEKRGLLWVICNQGGINAIDLVTGNCIKKYSYPIDHLQGQWRIAATSYKDKIYIGTSGGLEVFDITSATFNNSHLKSKPNNYFLSSDIRTISVNQYGILALGLLNKGIYFYNLEESKGSLLEPIKKSKRTTDFWPISGQFNKDNLYYCGTQNGYLVIDQRQQHIIYESNSTSAGLTGPVSAMLLKNGISILAADKLAAIDSQFNISYYIQPNFLEAEPWFRNITSIFQDDRNNTWIGARQGLCMIRNSDPVFHGIKNNTGKYSNKLGHIFAIGAIDSSTIITGTKDGLFALNKNEDLTQIYSNGLIQNIVRLNDERFIISGYNGSLLFFKGKITSLSSFYPELRPYQHWQFNSFVKVNDSISLLGSESNNGVLEWNTKKSTINHLHAKGSGNQSLVSDIVNSIFLTQSGQALILSDYYITAYSPKLQKSYSLKNQMANGIFMQMTEADSSYWIAAYGTGLVQTDFNFRVKKIYSTASGLSNSGLYSIFNYKDSLLFLTSNYGISVFNTKTKKFSNHFEADGLQNNTFEEASRDQFGGIFFAGGSEGFVKIYPSRLSADTIPPRFYFSNLLVEGTTSTMMDTVNLESVSFSIPSNSIQTKIFFSGIHYKNPGRINYAYKIEEMGNRWIFPGNQHFIQLIGLSPGTYHLQVQAFNEDGVGSEIKELTLIFLPKWYQTWWFKSLIAMALMAIAYGLYRMRINQLRKEEKIRNQLASDLHDDLGSTLNSIKVHSNLAQMEKENPNHLVMVKQGAQDAINGVRDIIWVLDDKKDQLGDTFTRVGQFAEPLCLASRIQYKAMLEDETQSFKLGKEEKRNLYMIIKESINNSLKYAESSQITLHASRSDKKLRIEISDNGKGFDMAATGNGYGLRNIRNRAKTVGYAAEIISSPGAGTRILLQKM